MALVSHSVAHLNRHSIFKFNFMKVNTWIVLCNSVYKSIFTRTVDCQASDDPIHESGLTIHSSIHKPFNLY